MGDEVNNENTLEEKTVAMKDVASSDTNDESEEPPTAKKKSKLKKILIYSVAGLIVFMLILVLSLGMIIKGAVDNILPQVTGTPCSIGFCSFNPITGTIRVSGLEIGNPEGYGEKNAFTLKHMKISVDVASLLSDTVVVKEITITGMDVDMETKTLTETNLTDIKANIDEFMKKTGIQTEKKEPESGEEPPAEEEAPGKKIIIKMMHFEDNSVTMGVAGKTMSVPMVPFTINDIGTEEGGVTPAQAAFDIITAITVNVTKTSSAAVADSVKEGTNSVIEGVKGLFGGGKKKK